MAPLTAQSQNSQSKQSQVRYRPPPPNAKKQSHTEMQKCSHILKQLEKKRKTVQAFGKKWNPVKQQIIARSLLVFVEHTTISYASQQLSEPIPPHMFCIDSPAPPAPTPLQPRPPIPQHTENNQHLWSLPSLASNARLAGWLAGCLVVWLVDWLD